MTCPAVVLTFLFAHIALGTVTDFHSPEKVPSAGGKATCYVGPLSVTTKAINTHLDFDSNPSQAVITDTINEFLKPGGNFTTSVLGGPVTVKGTYEIYSKLCIPNHLDAATLDTIQFLTHGGSLTSFYYDIAPGNSYVDAAAEAGYATFSYDRLGSGQFERPDPVQVVQGSLQVEIMHELTQALRTGAIGGHAYSRVAAVSHSLACPLTIGQVVRYPKDFEAIVLSGTSISTNYIGATLAGPAYVPASTDPRFRDLPNSYILYVGQQALQLMFFKYPHYDPKILEMFTARRDTATFGEFLTVSGLVKPTTYTGPVYVINGEADFPFCGGNCYHPSDQTALVTPALFPAASKGSQHYIVPLSGHNIFAHNKDIAKDSFDKILGFFAANGLRGKIDHSEAKHEL